MQQFVKKQYVKGITAFYNNPGRFSIPNEIYEDSLKNTASGFWGIWRF